MRYIAHFYQLNYDFSPEFAAAHHHGEESENNRKYDWEDELAITSEVANFEVIEHGKYVLRGESEGESFQEEVNDMLLFRFVDAGGNVTEMACSHALVNNYRIQEDEATKTIEVFLEETEPLTNPIPGIYIAVSDFPKWLMG